MNNRKKALIALAVGGMLVGTTGTTLALWQDNGSLEAGAIDTGRLDLDHSQGFGPLVWNWSIQRGSQVINAGHGETPDRAVQANDVITATTYVDADLAGTNLVAQLVPTDTDYLRPTVDPSVLPDTVSEEIRNAFNAINAEEWEADVTVNNTGTLSGLGSSDKPIAVIVTITVPQLPVLPLAVTNELGIDPETGRGILTQDVNFGRFTLVLEQVRTAVGQ